MAATWTTNVTLNKKGEFYGYIDCCNSVGAYVVIVKSEKPKGGNAIFNIASANDGQKRIKRIVSVPGNNGEQLCIVWPENSCPILYYESDHFAPDEEMHYNVKVL